jgi:hypothetical protein
MFHDILLVQGSTIMPATPQYERNRLARVARLRAEAAAPLAQIHKIAAQLVYDEKCHGKQRRKGEDGGSGSEYEPNDDEEADEADGVSGEEEEQEPTIHISKARVPYLSVIHSSVLIPVVSQHYWGVLMLVYTCAHD